MSAALKFAPHYTHKDYVQWMGDWELWEGIAVAMSPSPFGRHQRVVTALAAELLGELRRTNSLATALARLDWIIADDTVVRPDVMVVCGDPPEEYMRDVPGLVAEVLSDSTRQNDLTYKRQLYQREGVETYVIVDPGAETIEIDRRQDDGSYVSENVTGQLRVRVCDGCELQVDLGTIFRI